MSTESKKSFASTATLTPRVEELAVPGLAPDNAKELRHHRKDAKGFINPWESWHDLEVPKIIRTMLWRRISGASNNPLKVPPTLLVDKPVFLPSRTTERLRATWLGHACFYVEFPGGLRVLFDPVFEDRCSPFTFMGPKRYTKAPCTVEDIPTIDAVVISHNHYDHLSHPTVTKIAKLHPAAHFFVPLGNKKWFHDSGIDNVTELDWWEQRKFTVPLASSEGDEALTAVIGSLPCQHTSARTAFDRSHTLWSSWSVESGGAKLYFAGDTGYRAVPDLPESIDDYADEYKFPHCPAFKEVGDLRGPFDLGLIPIGAYSPRWIMSSMHANAFDAAKIFLDTRCKRALGMHWGTWVLTEEDAMEPPAQLRQALAREKVPEEGVFDVCNIGASREFKIADP